LANQHFRNIQRLSGSNNAPSFLWRPFQPMLVIRLRMLLLMMSLSQIRQIFT